MYGTALGTPIPPVPRLAPLWEWVGWLWMGGIAG